MTHEELQARIKEAAEHVSAAPLESFEPPSLVKIAYDLQRLERGLSEIAERIARVETTLEHIRRTG
jgi:hypothetical protein